MEWLMNAFWAKIGWALGELAIAAGVMLAIVFVLAFVNLPRIIRQARCKHTRFHETGSCDAICTNCGKNLGFIGALANDHGMVDTSALRRTRSGPKDRKRVGTSDF